MDPIFSAGDVALFISIIWVFISGLTLAFTYFIKAYSTPTAITQRVFKVSGFILIPGSILLTILAIITNQINKPMEPN